MMTKNELKNKVAKTSVVKIKDSKTIQLEQKSRQQENEKAEIAKGLEVYSGTRQAETAINNELKKIATISPEAAHKLTKDAKQILNKTKLQEKTVLNKMEETFKKIQSDRIEIQATGAEAPERASFTSKPGNTNLRDIIAQQRDTPAVEPPVKEHLNVSPSHNAPKQNTKNLNIEKMKSAHKPVLPDISHQTGPSSKTLDKKSRVR